MGMNALVVAVVDDEPAVRKALQRLLSSVGIRVEEFGSGALFLASLEHHVPDCVVLDLHMPEVSGYDVQAALARRDEATPVVVITGHDTPTARARAIGAGAAAYLCKPVDDEALLGAIMRATTPASTVRPGH